MDAPFIRVAPAPYAAPATSKCRNFMKCVRAAGTVSPALTRTCDASRRRTAAHISQQEGDPRKHSHDVWVSVSECAHMRVIIRHDSSWIINGYSKENAFSSYRDGRKQIALTIPL